MTKEYSDFFEIIAGQVETRVGKTGRRSVTISDRGDRLIRIGLARGGVVVPQLSDREFYEARRSKHVYSGGEKKGELMYPDAKELVRPFFDKTLTIVRTHVAVEGPEGRNSEMTMLDDDLSHQYVIKPTQAGVWLAYDTFHESSSNYWTDSTRYHLASARPVETKEEVLTVGGLITLFDTGVILHGERAVRADSGRLPQGQ